MSHWLEANAFAETVLVTGAGGFIGGGVARALVTGGAAVHAMQRGDYPELVAAALPAIAVI